MGKNLEPLPESHKILRLAVPPKDFEERGRVLANQLNIVSEAFTLSSSDKESVPPHLSVWSEMLTTPEQAYSFLPKDSPKRLVLRLRVNEVRDITSKLGDTIYSDLLDVIWIGILETKSGAEGHAGITGLNRDTDAPENLTKAQKKLLFKDMRFQLSELASQDCWLLF